MNTETQIYQRFHVIDDMKMILLHNLTRLNQLQNEHHLFESDLIENGMFYEDRRQQEMENQKIDKELVISSLASRCTEDVERLIIETIFIIDLYKKLEDKSEMNILFMNKFVSFLEGISELESLFLCRLNQIEELMLKIKLFGEVLQEVLHFEIQIENIDFISKNMDK